MVLKKSLDAVLKHEFFTANEPVLPKNDEKPSMHDKASVYSDKTLVNDDEISVKGGKKIVSDVASVYSKEDEFLYEASFYYDDDDDDDSDIISIGKPKGEKGEKNKNSKLSFIDALKNRFQSIKI